MNASRKRSFQGPEPASSRKTLEQGHIHQKHRGERKSFVDSQNKSESAVQVVHCMKDISVKRLTNNLMQMSEKWEQKTLNEMLRKGKDPELVKKVYRNLILVEEQRVGLAKQTVKAGTIRLIGMGVEETCTDQVESVEEAEELPAQEEDGETL
ncbi:MAG: hypothetical protein RR930_06335 [Clostridium sp.]